MRQITNVSSTPESTHGEESGHEKNNAKNPDI